jgi:hypothetical protein
MTKIMYTVLNHNGDVQAQGVDLEEAAHIVLTYDGHDYEIRRDEDGGYSLFVSQFSLNSPFGGRPLARCVEYFKDEAEIHQFVVDHATRWQDQTVMTDDDYAQMVQKINAF